MATLNLPDSARVLVWRLIQARLQADTTLGAAGLNLLFFDGGPDDEADVAELQGASVRFYPVLTGGSSWFDPSTERGTLTVAIEASLPSTDAEDVLNLQAAIEGALYPSDGRAFLQSLITAGATIGQFVFQPLTQPLSTAGTNRGFRPLGAFSIEVLRSLNA